MFGLVGDDLTVVLFFVGLAATLVVAAMSQAGWKQPAFIVFLLFLAVAFFAAGVGWPWIKEISPDIQRFATRIARSPIAWFVVIICGLSASLFLNKSAGQPKGQKLGKIRTGITLEFVPGQTTHVASNLQNIWRWYTLAQVMREVTPDGILVREHVTMTVFLVFDRPIDVKQITVASEGGLSLPPHDLKDWGARHAVIVFLDDPSGCIVGIKARV
jgi:hypothetical protein